MAPPVSLCRTFFRQAKKTLVTIPFRRRHHFCLAVLVDERFFHPFAICEDIYGSFRLSRIPSSAVSSSAKTCSLCFPTRELLKPFNCKTSLSSQLNFEKHRVSHSYSRRLPRRLQSPPSHHSIGMAHGQEWGMGVGCFEGATNCRNWCCSTPRKACQRRSCSDSAALTLSQRFS